MARPQMRGPGGRRGMMGGKRSKNPKKTLGRLMKYIQKGYGVQFVVVLICILLSAVANVAGSMFLKSLIDDYISPLLLQASPVFTGRHCDYVHLQLADGRHFAGRAQKGA